MDFQQHFLRVAVRCAGRKPRRNEGVSAADLRKCERRLGFRLPRAMRDFYRSCGRFDELTEAHNQLWPLRRLQVKEEHLWFMEENQEVVYWGVPVDQLSKDDPIVYQRANEQGARWYSERMRFSRFLKAMYEWQAGRAEAPR